MPNAENRHIRWSASRSRARGGAMVWNRVISCEIGVIESSFTGAQIGVVEQAKSPGTSGVVELVAAPALGSAVPAVTSAHVSIRII